MLENDGPNITAETQGRKGPARNVSEYKVAKRRND